MIQSKKDLQFYIREDRVRNLGNISRLSYFAQRIYKTDRMVAYLYLKQLRKYEYAVNCLKNKYLWGG